MTVPEEPSLDFSYADDKENGQFVLQIRNSGGQEICVSPATWPNENDFIPETSANIFVKIGRQVFPLRTNEEYCPDCVIRLLSGDTMTRHLSYEKFSIPESLRNKEKLLHIEPAGVGC
jgi:hypothetical protein